MCGVFVFPLSGVSLRRYPLLSLFFQTLLQGRALASFASCLVYRPDTSTI